MSKPKIALHRRIALSSIALGMCAMLPLQTFAQADTTAKPLRMVVPFPAGGTADVLPRILAEKMRDAYPAGILIENKTGAGGNVGGEFVARAEPDGNTLLVSPPGPVAINHNLYKTMSFDPTKWVPITVVATVPNVLAVSNKLPVNNFNEFVAYLKANPEKVSYASQGNGSTSHLTANLFMQLTGTRMLHVPYRGTAPALNDLVSGQVDVFFDNIASSAQFHTAKRIKVLAVADSRRSRALPEISTFTELNLPAMQAVTFFSVVAPPGTPAAIARRIHGHLAAAMALPDVKEKFAAQGAEPGGQSPENTTAFIQAESAKWKKVISTANVTLD